MKASRVQTVARRLMLFVVVFALGGYPGALHSQSADQPAVRMMSLKECVQLALRQNPDLLLSRLENQESALRARQLGDPFSLKFGVGSGLAYTTGFPMSVGGSGPSIINAQASMTLFDSSLRYRLAEARERGRGAVFGDQEKQAAITLEIARLYLNVEALSHAEASMRAELASLDRVHAIRQQQAAEGHVLPLDVKRASLALAAARYRMKETQTSLARAQAQLAFLLGMENGARVAVVEEERQMPELPADPEDAGRRAVEASLELKRLETDLAANRFRLKSAGAAHWPVIRLVSEYAMFGKFNNYSDYYNRFERHNAQLGASFELPLFTGSAAKAEKSEAAVETERLRLSVATAKKRIALEAADAARVAEDARAYRDVAGLDLEAAREQVDVLLARVDEGQAKIEDLEAARSELTRKQAEYYRSRASAEQALYELLHKTGNLVAWFQ